MKKTQPFNKSYLAMALRDKKIFDYLIGDRESFFDGGTFLLWKADRRCKEMGLKRSVLSILRRRDESLDYTYDPLADSVEIMADRILLW